ncbi:MAG: hypothetical protein J07HR59_01121, partial [Halorubrum sp. J07HR59]
SATDALTVVITTTTTCDRDDGDQLAQIWARTRKLADLGGYRFDVA